MASKTPNYNLNKPAMNEYASPVPFNDNSDILDRELKSVSDVANAANTLAGSANTKAETAATKATEAVNGLGGKADKVHTHSQYLQASDIAGKANKPTKSLTTMYAASWNASSKIYDFTGTYPTAAYDLEIEIASNATEEQIDAYTAAKIVASSDLTNKAVAMGDIPTIDIPILLTVTGK